MAVHADECASRHERGRSTGRAERELALLEEEFAKIKQEGLLKELTNTDEPTPDARSLLHRMRSVLERLHAARGARLRKR